MALTVAQPLRRSYVLLAHKVVVVELIMLAALSLLITVGFAIGALQG